MTNRVRMYAATATMVLLVVGLIGVVADFTPLMTVCLLCFFVLAPGAAAVQFVRELDAGLSLGITVLCGPVSILLLGLIMAEIPFWHPIVAALIVGVPSCVGNAYGLIEARRRRQPEP
jgi:hypothetical protein